MQAVVRSNTDILISILLMFGLVAGLGWFLWRTLKRTEDPPRLIFKWILTVIAVGVLLRVVMPIVAQGGYGGAFVGIPATAVVGLFLAIVWRYNIAMFFAKPFASLYDGGTEEPEKKPFYSSAQAKRKRGDFMGAKADVREQLLKFPEDAEGMLLLAEIEAQDLQDLSAADVVIQRFIHHKGRAPAQIAYALNSMADWQLKYAQDREAARACLEKIGELLPGSEWALRAAQRVAHLGDVHTLLGAQDRQTFKVRHIEGDPGLGGAWGHVQPAPEESAADLAAKYVRHLEEFPLDTEVREQLAHLYAEHFKRLDLAQDQMEQLIQYPHQPVKQVVRWLNMLADWQVKYGGTLAATQATLQRLIELYPESGAANMARNRLELLRLEFKANEKSQAIPLGSYEDDLGLKGGLPH